MNRHGEKTKPTKTAQLTTTLPCEHETARRFARLFGITIDPTVSDAINAFAAQLRAKEATSADRPVLANTGRIVGLAIAADMALHRLDKAPGFAEGSPPSDYSQGYADALKNFAAELLESAGLREPGYFDERLMCGCGGTPYDEHGDYVAPMLAIRSPKCACKPFHRHCQGHCPEARQAQKASSP